MDYYQALSRYCSYQDRCLQEIEEKLQGIQVPKDEWNLIIEQLQADGFWDEERFARSYARGKFRIKRWGKIRIQQELRMRGMNGEMIQRAFEEIDESEYSETLIKLMRKKRIEVQNEPGNSARQKVNKYLVQKGFEPHLVNEIIAGYWNDTE